MNTFDKTLLTLSTIDLILRNWAKGADIVLKQDVVQDFTNLSNYINSNTNSPELLGNEYKRMAFKTALYTFPTMHSQKSFETIVADMICEMLGINYTIPKKKIEYDENNPNILLASTRVLSDYASDVPNRNIPEDLCEAYYDRPFSIVKQLLFLIRRAWSQRIVKDTYSLYDAVSYAHRFAKVAKDFLTKISYWNDDDMSEMNLFDEKTPEQLYKELQELNSIIILLSNEKKALSEQYFRIKNLFMTLEYFYQKLGLFRAKNVLYGNTDMHTGDDPSNNSFIEPYDPCIFHYELSLIDMTEFQLFTDYTRTLKATICDLDLDKYSSEGFKKSCTMVTPFQHPFLGYANDSASIGKDFANLNASLLHNKDFLQAVQEYGTIVNSSCADCPYVTSTCLNYNMRSKNEKTRELCSMGGCNTSCKTHIELMKASLKPAQIYEDTKS